jgi:hypothetical protein
MTVIPGELQGPTVSLHESGAMTTRGVQRCGSLAACPVCADVGRLTRAGEIDRIRAAAQAAGCTVLLVTATASHSEATDLRAQCSAIQYAWSGAWAGSAMKRHGYLGQARAWDFTYGSNGWHPHLHALVFVSDSQTPAEAEAFAQSRFDTYAKRLRAKGCQVRRAARGVSVGWDVQVVDDSGVAAEYVAGSVSSKSWSAALEVAYSPGKRESVTPWAILRAAVDGEVPAGTVLEGRTVGELWAIWRQYEEATKGLNQIVIGRGLAERFAVELVAEGEECIGADESPVVAEISFSISEWMGLLGRGRLYLAYEAVHELALRQREGPPP